MQDQIKQLRAEVERGNREAATRLAIHLAAELANKHPHEGTSSLAEQLKQLEAQVANWNSEGAEWIEEHWVVRRRVGADQVWAQARLAGPNSAYRGDNWATRPIGPHLLKSSVVMSLLLAFFIIWLFRPVISRVTVDPPPPTIVRAGGDVKIEWETSYFADVVIDEVGGEYSLYRSGQWLGYHILNPTHSTIYKIRAENWLSKLLPFLAPEPVLIEVEVVDI